MKHFISTMSAAAVVAVALSSSAFAQMTIGGKPVSQADMAKVTEYCATMTKDSMAKSGAMDTSTNARVNQTKTGVGTNSAVEAGKNDATGSGTNGAGGTDVGALDSGPTGKGSQAGDGANSYNVPTDFSMVTYEDCRAAGLKTM